MGGIVVQTGTGGVRGRSRRRGLDAVGAMVAGVVLLGAGACSGDDSEGASAPSSEGPTTTVVELVPFTDAPFDGTDEEFYQPPDPLPEGAPGELIRVQELDGIDGNALVKVMYHSRDAADRDRAVTGMVGYPTGEAPKNGWPVMTTPPGFKGLAPPCGSSLHRDQLPDLHVEGVQVMTDFIGLGTEGGPPHPFLSKPSEGHSVIDGVRAAQQLPDAHAGDRWLSVGFSQGAHAALSASELAADYAPELDLIATLAMSPPSMFENVYGEVDTIAADILNVMNVYGGAGEHPEIDPADYVTDKMAETSEVFETGCYNEITAALVPLAANGELFTNDPRVTEPAKSMLVDNDVGEVVVDAPLFLVAGTADSQITIDRMRDLYARLCETGQVAELLIIEGASHETMIPASLDANATWLNARLAGEPPTNSCDESPTATGFGPDR